MLGISHQRNDDGKFFRWQLGMTKCIFTVSLLQYSFRLNRFGAQETEGAIFQDWSVALGLRPITVFVVSENHDSGLGAMWVAVLVGFDDKNTHGWECFSNFAAALELEVSFLVDSLIDIKLD
jgi:hypothetical protein